MKRIIYAFCAVTILGSPAVAAETPQRSATAAPTSVATLRNLTAAASGNRILRRPVEATRIDAPVARPPYLTVEQEESVWRHAFEVTFNVDHSP